MGTQQPDQQRLGQHVRRRRLQLGLSRSAAARAAGVDRATWTAVEDGTRNTRDDKFAGIEAALEWLPGHVEAVLTGQDRPPSGERARLLDHPDLLDRYDRVMADPRAEPADRRDIVAFLLELAGHRAAQAAPEQRRNPA